MVLGRVLVIAGSDCSGGAGLEADQKVIAAHGCYAMTATTALTAQNTTGVFDIHHVPADFLRKQIDACIEDIGVDVVKTGMLASAGTVDAVAAALEAHKVKTLVVDPVMVSTSGSQLLPSAALDALRSRLLPMATILTPNLPEARLLLADSGHGFVPVEKISDLEYIAQLVRNTGPKWVLIKGGHCPFRKDGTVAKSPAEKEIVVDVLYGGGDELFRIETPYHESRNTHGTGCSLASAIASNLATGMDVVPAVKAACRYVEAGIKTAPGLGSGSGPLNHFHSVSRLPFSPGHFVDYVLEHPDVAPVWHRFVNHPFVLAMGNGTLPLESFKGYLVQDYLYLIQFARANALASYKARSMHDIVASAEIVSHIFREMQLHVGYCEGFGISKEEMEQTEEKEGRLTSCTAYTRYVLDVGQSEDLIGLHIALAPCLLGYGVLAEQLHKDPNSNRESNPYWDWIENYVADDYVTAVKTGRGKSRSAKGERTGADDELAELLERHAMLQGPSRIEELVKIFIHATKMEVAFWEMYSSE
ncbi:Phosphomethylpyrimidine kinase-domain-containing protein [Cercophora newfieldiana]|uniref:Phosphomethylpyrimidine kinase-domain-containing protein n=1 Tax=Cercophora newfieldiana TaxID=92897 RepID=A0AA39Y619_9PEZI|nr:Phosphomethylpyrimidine kinase-domain-containing protein [Cercophora newfieldiana]